MNDPLIHPTSATQGMNRIGGPGQGANSPHAPVENRPSTDAATISRSSNEGAQWTQAFVSELPLEILKDPEAALAEWAWRRELSAAASTDAAAEISGTNASLGDGVIASVRQLWAMLTELSGADIAQRWQVDIPIPQVDSSTGNSPSILSFASLTQLPETWTDALKALVLRDRLVSSVHDGNHGHVGEGVFVIPLASDGLAANSLVTLTPTDHQRVRVARWRAERHSMPVEGGKQVHRLRLEVRVEGKPVEITVLSCHPSLSIHVATDHKQVRESLESAEGIRKTMLALGWQLERWSVSDLASGGET